MSGRSRAPGLGGGLAAREACKKLGFPEPRSGLEVPQTHVEGTTRMLRQVRSKTKSLCAKGMSPWTERC